MLNGESCIDSDCVGSLDNGWPLGGSAKLKSCKRVAQVLARRGPSSWLSSSVFYGQSANGWPSAVADPWLKGGRPGWWADEFFIGVFISVDCSFVTGSALLITNCDTPLQSHWCCEKKNQRPAVNGSRADVQGRPDSYLTAGSAPIPSVKQKRTFRTASFLLCDLFVLDDSPNSTTRRSLPAGHESVKVR